jgi:hypothetical protein
MFYLIKLGESKSAVYTRHRFLNNSIKFNLTTNLLKQSSSQQVSFD